MANKTHTNTGSIGTHLIVDLWQCDKKLLDDKDFLIDLLKTAIRVSNATLLGTNAHKFSPHGVTAVALLSESHMSIHTWPELGYAAVDVFTCGETMQPEKAAGVFKESLKAKEHATQTIYRGIDRPLSAEAVGKRKNYWFTEDAVPFYESGIHTYIHVKEKLHEEQSAYQHLQALDTDIFGKTLVLDRIVQTTENDEFIYHEMITLLPCLVRKNPKRVLIIGGGDGGSLREAVRVKSVEEAIMVEIDDRVVEVSKQYLPMLSAGAFTNKKAKLIIGDGMAFTRKYKNYFDVIVLDLTDPVVDGPAVALFQQPFLKDVKKALKKNGVVSVQSGSISFQKEWVKKLYTNIKNVFPFVEVRTALVPAYQVGMFTFIMASQTSFAVTLSAIKKNFKKIIGKTKYLTPEIYFASKVLPKFQEDYLQSK